MVIDLITSFYIGFVFISSKIYTNYYWVLFYLQEFHVKGDILNLIFVETNCKKALIRVLEIIFPQTKHGLCP